MRVPIKKQPINKTHIIKELGLLQYCFKSGSITKLDATELLEDIVVVLLTEPDAYKITRVFQELTRDKKPRTLDSVMNSIHSLLMELEPTN